MRFSATNVRRGRKHLRSTDPVMRTVIDAVGPCRLEVQPDRFRMLVNSIISQQISVHAARSIRRRLQASVSNFDAQALLALNTQQLNAAGLSQQKIRYIRDLCEHVAAGSLNLNQLGRFSDERIIEQLIVVKGIGRWTAQMFLIFALGRLDVFPFDDLGVRTAIKQRYGLSDLPDRDTGLQIADRWRPFASIASWYCWRSLELPTAGKGANQ